MLPLPPVGVALTAPFLSPQGILDIMVLSEGHTRSNFAIHALKNNFEADAYFVKVIGECLLSVLLLVLTFPRVVSLSVRMFQSEDTPCVTCGQLCRSGISVSTVLASRTQTRFQQGWSSSWPRVVTSSALDALFSSPVTQLGSCALCRNPAAWAALCGPRCLALGSTWG